MLLKIYAFEKKVVFPFRQKAAALWLSGRREEENTCPVFPPSNGFPPSEENNVPQMYSSLTLSITTAKRIYDYKLFKNIKDIYYLFSQMICATFSSHVNSRLVIVFLLESSRCIMDPYRSQEKGFPNMVIDLQS